MFPWLLKKSKVVHTVTGLKLQNWTGEDYQPLTRWEFCLKRQTSVLRDESLVSRDNSNDSCIWETKAKCFLIFGNLNTGHILYVKEMPQTGPVPEINKNKKMSLFTLHVIANMKEKEFSFMRENCVWLKQWIKRAMTCTHCKWNVTCINGMQWNSWVYT